MQIIKKLITDLVLIDEKTTMEQIITNDKMAPCYAGGITQYILDEEGKLKGIITSLDISRSHGDIEKYINNNPIEIIENPLAVELAAKIFEKKNISQVPVVDRENHLLYVLERANEMQERFYSYYNREYDIDGIQKAVLDMKRKYPDKKVYLLTTEEIPELSELMIDLEQLDSSCYGDYVLVFAFRFEYEATEIFKELKKKHIKYFICPLMKNQFRYSVMKYMNTDETAVEVLLEEADKNGSYYDADDFQDMFQALSMTKDLDGCLLEIGVYRGDSGRAMLSYMKKNNIKRKSWFLDLFEGFIYAEDSGDIAISIISPHTDTSYEIAKERLSEFEDIELIKTDIVKDELSPEIGEVAVCNIDLGMYETENAALNKVRDKIVKGGIIITHNYGRTPGCIGAHLAIREFYEENRDKFYGIYMSSGQFLMIRK